MSADPRAIAASYRLYRVLLWSYPRRFRLAYREEVAQVFRDCCREAQRAHGTRGLVRVWARALLDLSRNVPREYLVQWVVPPKAGTVECRSCSGCNSEIQPGWRVCKICGTYLDGGSTHDTHPIPEQKVHQLDEGFRGLNHPLSFRDPPDR